MRPWSSAFEEGEPIPVGYTEDGWNICRLVGPIYRELVLIFEGITPATHELWVHWVAYKILADANGLPKGYQHRRGPEEPVPILQGRNSLGNVGYDGPQGTIGRSFRYRIRLLALAGIDRPPAPPMQKLTLLT